MEIVFNNRQPDFKKNSLFYHPAFRSKILFIQSLLLYLKYYKNELLNFYHNYKKIFFV